MTTDEFLAVSDERDTQERRRLAESRESYWAGYRQAVLDIRRKLEADWAAAPVASPVGMGLTFQELDRRRYPDGRPK